MVRIAALALVGVALAAAAAVWLAPRERDEALDAWSGTAALAQRIDLLEASLREEMDQRVLLELELLALREELAQLRAEPRIAAADPGDERPSADPDSRDPDAPLRDRAAERFAQLGSFGRGDPSARRLDRLIAAGFSTDRAEWIERRTEELRMAALQAQYDAVRDGGSVDARTAWSGERALRQELGDADYERYLQALSRPISVGVRQVLASSPAERAGLQSGDQIVAYGGERVFSMTDLNELTFQGQAGQPVAVDVLRDGRQIQLYVARGPVGIVGGGRLPPRRP